MRRRLPHSSLSIISLLTPGLALAHGEDVLVTLYAQFAVALITLIAVVIWTASRKRKVYVLGGLVLGTLVAWLATANIPYQDNADFITTVNVLLPLLGSLVALKLTKRYGLNKQ